MIEKEDFEAWRDNPITQKVMAWAGNYETEIRQEWASLLDGTDPDRRELDGLPLLLTHMRAQLQLARDFSNVELNDIEPEEDEQSQDKAA